MPDLQQPDLPTFIKKMKNINGTVRPILQKVKEEEVKSCLESLTNLCAMGGLLLENCMQEQLKNKIKEGIEEERRARSVVISGLPESNASSLRKRHEDDLTQVYNIIETCQIEAMPTTLFRMGPIPKVNGPHANSRLLKLELHRKKATKELLRNRSKLKMEGSKYQNIYIRESLSAEFLEKHAELKAQRNLQNGALTGQERKENPFVVYGPPGEWIITRKADIPNKQKNK